MQFFGFNITEHLHGRWCRFIIHRYCGQFLDKHLSLDQLSIDLSKGFVKIEQVSLNAEYINETLASLNLPLRLIDGFIGSINIRVPWTSLMAEASEVDLSDVQLTFRGMDSFKVDDKDLVSSIQSVVESIVSSMDVAQSFRQEEKDEGEKESTEEGSVHALSKVIEAVVSRFCCNIDDLILRLESNAPANNDVATAVEFKIEKLRFMDEQMKRCQQEGTSAETITSQPHGLSTLNKYINVEGVSLYTDVFSMADLPPAEDESQLITSMSLRREHKKLVQPNENTQSLQQAGSPLASMYMSTHLADSMQMSDVYQSIRSHASVDEYHSLAPEPAGLISNPVKFAEIAGETTVVIRIKNSDGNLQNSRESKYEFDVYSKGINVLVTPSQVELIKNLTGLLIPVEQPVRKKTSCGGEPMDNRDFDLVNRQLDDITTSYTSAGNALGRQGNWQGAQDCNSFKSISLKDDFQQRVDADYCELEQAVADRDNRETAMVSVKIGTILAILTHDDPLSSEFVGERGSREAIDLLHKNAKRFFERAAELNIYHAMSISSMRKATDGLYLKDHIRLIGSTTSVSYSVESGAGSRMSTKLAVANCDISEYLTAASTMEGIARHNPLFAFEKDDDDQDNQFTVLVKIEGGKSSTVISLGKCCSEVDASIIDRISHLVYPRPFFAQPTRGYTPTRTYSGVYEDLFAEEITKEASSSIEVNCANWSVDLKIPKIDFREEGDNERISHTVQNLHDEFLRLQLISCKVLIPSSKNKSGPKIVEIIATSLTGHFIGDLENLGCSEADTAFLYAGSKGKPVRISLEFDGSNKSLKAAKLLSTMPEDMTKSISADIIKNRPKRDGPFSQTQQSFTKSDASSDDEHIIRAGSRDEMAAFARDCMEQSDVTLRIDLPILRLLVPNHHFLELLYNRLVNGFALWKPSAPAFNAKNASLNINFDDGFREVKSSLHAMQEDSDDDDDVNDYSRTERNASARRAQSHAFALNLEVVNGTMVMGTEVAPAFGDDSPPRPAQVVSELGGTQLFVCSGFHGDSNQTFFHMTTTNVTVAQRNEPTIAKNVLNREFGSHDRSEVHLRSLAAGSTLREGRRDDSLGVALHIVTSQGGRVQETTAAIALRLFELNLIPVKRIEENWMMQLKGLFNLTDFEIPGYEMPVCNTYLHVHLDHAVLAHDHCRIVNGSPLKYKFVLGHVDINSTIVPSMKVNKFLCLFERVHLHMMKEYEEKRTVSYDDDEPKIKKAPNMVHIMEIGFFQLELLMLNELMAREDETRNCPLFELRCQNDQIKAWVCHDSLVSLINSIVEVSQADMWKEETTASDGLLLPDDETRSESSAFTKSTASTMKTGILLSPDAERRLKLLVEDALEDAPLPPTPTPSTYEEHDNDSQAQLNLLEDAMRDLGMGQEPGMSRTSSFSTDDSFVMVDNIPGCGITSLSGEPRIRLIDPDDMAESGEYYYNYIPEHIASGDVRSDCISLPADHPLPLIRCQLKDISIQLHIFGGNDLGHGPDVVKSYSSDEYKTGSGRGQRIAMEARGGSFRDHSVSVCLELDKISYLHQMFDKEATVRSMNFITIQDVTIHDKLTLSNIKEMLYQYSTSEQPRRTCAPMLAVRMVENHEQEAKLRVSMLPIRLNIDQDTMEFLEDFIQSVSTGLQLPESAKPHFINQPVIEVPSGIEPSAPPLSIRSSSSRARSRASSSCPSLSLLNDQPMTSSAVYPVLSPQPSIPNKRKESTSRLDMDAAQLQMALDEIDRPAGDWASSTSDLLSRSTMEGSIYGGGIDENNDDPITDEPILTSDRFTVNLNEDNEAGEGRYGEEEEDRETICSEAPRPRSLSENEEQIGGATFFKEFIFSPGCTIYVDYHGKNKYNIEKSGAVLGVLKGFGQLNRTEINLKPFECRNGLLGMGRCVSHAITEWQEDIVANIPYALSSVGPISPFFQIGKGICDLLYLPVSEMRKEDGHVVKGLQRGASSFGYSTAAAMVDLAQKLVGAVQVTAESVLYELTPTHPSLNNRNRRPVQQLMHNPRDMQHGMQLAYDLIATGVQQTREDLELATQEDRASGRSSMQSVLRHATPALLRPFIIGSQIGYHFLGGIKNQLRPDQFHDEQHKWRNERDRAGTGGN